MKRLFFIFGFVIMLLTLAACGGTTDAEYRAPEVEYHPSGFSNVLYANFDGKTHIYEVYEGGIGSLTPKTVLDTFTTETHIEGIVWDVYSTEEYPDLSYILVISGTNASWTCRILQ